MAGPGLRRGDRRARGFPAARRRRIPTEAPFRRLRLGVIALAIVLVAGTAGYLGLGFGLLDAIYQTVITITTVGFSSPHPFDTAGKIFTIVLLLVGVGTALYTFTAALEVLLEGHMRDLVRRRRMERDIARMTGHVIVCGCGRVGREVARFLEAAGRPLVVVDVDASRLGAVSYPTLEGDVTEDEILRAAGIERAGTLVAALNADADNLFVTLTARSMNSGLQIVARARSEATEQKLIKAGADKVVNPQRLGGDRMASFVVQPHVVDFVDIVMHDGTLEFRLEEVTVPFGSPLAGGSLRSTRLHDRTGALVLAIRHPDGTFDTNPSPGFVIAQGDVLICVGTESQLLALSEFAGAPLTAPDGGGSR